MTFTIPKALWLTSNRHHANRAYLQRIRNDLHVIAHAAAQRTGLHPISSPVHCLWTVHYPKGVGWEHGDASNAQPTPAQVAPNRYSGTPKAGLRLAAASNHKASKKAPWANWAMRCGEC